MSRYFHFIPILLIAAVASGCRTVETARQVQQDRPEARRNGEHTATAQQAAITAGAVYSLAELEQIALRYNPAVLQAAIAVDQAQLSLEDARAGYLPTLTASAGHSRHTSNTDRHRQGTSNTGSYSGSLNFSLTLYDFGRTAAAVESAQAALAAAQADYEEARNKVVHDLRSAFFAVLRARDLHAVAQESVQQYREHLEQVRAKFEVGMGMRYDVTKAEVDYHNAQLEEITTANDMQTGQARLGQCLGLAESADCLPGDFKLKEYQADAQALMEIARSHSPALSALRYRIDAASAKIDAAIAQLYPDLSLSLSGSASGRNPAFPWLWNLSGAISVAQNLFNAGYDVRTVENAALSLQLARSSYATREQSLYYTVRTTALTLRRAQQQMAVAALSERSAKENLDIVNEKFNLGKASSVERTDAQVAYSSAKASAVSAYYDYQDAQASAAYCLGE